ncbi:dTDP-glucose 4,6-dehydratase [Candidatus Falkowbacteria bacterium CG10_big_fil_rev_8_21_14_0_10_43_10]|uniref:dTDP-glucose 4,6-dehydratase n=1 Tax=Candidatus Falkowbacteria bacterium CG10_big_fil_rev_8_21_14_0_10_43_10 TaxID=1974567 RepID=A0A2H0V3J9_9BACT|nr:MAG: dTDP-glucose 4,6-dehydratase [Candidatus Falkowbacteria bacterium CG10_big_fil_rev_8_21_14_0_10_43_10]
MRLLITGGCGFIGSNFIHYWLKKYPNDQIVNLDLLTYAGNLENLRDVENNPNYKFVQGDISDLEKNKNLLRDEKIEVVVNFAAESHNGRAMIEPDIFVKTNVLGTQMLLEAAKDASIQRFHHISTCEVFGDLALDEERAFKEDDPYRPKTPYNSTKAGANHEVMAYYHTFKLPVTISHCSNNYGPYQFPEKVIPRFITNALQNQELPLFKSSLNKREWLHTEDHCRAIDMIIKKGRVGEAYNIGSNIEKSVEEIAEAVISRLNKPASLKTYVEDRPGHDRRYLLDIAKIKNELDWHPEIDFEKGMDKTVKWYIKNEKWWRSLLGKGFVENYKKL